MINMTEKEFHFRYQIPREEILQNRRAFHYFHEYVLAWNRNPKILGRAYRELGVRGVVQIARWLNQNSDILIAIARRQAAVATKKEAI